MGKVLFIAMNLNSGGAERQTVAIAKALKGQGYDVTVACYSNGDFYLSDLEQAGIRVVWMIEKQYIKRVLRFRKFIRNGGFDAVFSLLVTPNILNIISAFGGKKWKVILGERSAKSEFFNSIKAKFIKTMLRHADAIVCNSENAANIWRNFAPRNAHKVKCIYNLLPQYTSSATYIPKQRDRVNVVIAASYQPLKNMKRLILALSKLSAEERQKIYVDWYGQINVSIYGTMPYDESKALIKEHNLESVISLNPPTTQIYELMNLADAVALVSEVEGLPNVICEALMLGKPIIMSNVSDYKVLVGNNNGFVCEYNDVDSITKALRSIIALNEEQLLELGSRSHDIYKDKLAPEVIVNEWTRLIVD